MFSSWLSSSWLSSLPPQKKVCLISSGISLFIRPHISQQIIFPHLLLRPWVPPFCWKIITSAHLMWSYCVRQRAEVFHSLFLTLDTESISELQQKRRGERKRKHCNLMWLSNWGFNYIMSVILISRRIDGPLKNPIDFALFGFYQCCFCLPV